MKNSFQLFLTFAVALGAGPRTFIIAAPQVEECVICGHECCCPDVCAQKKLSTNKSCHSEEICKLKPADPSQLFVFQKEFLLIEPSAATFSVVRPESKNETEGMRPTRLVISESAQREIPTPPPRAV